MYLLAVIVAGLLALTTAAAGPRARVAASDDWHLWIPIGLHGPFDRSAVTAPPPSPSPSPSFTPVAPDWRPDRVFGQLRLSETAFNEVEADRLFHPGGVVVDRMPEGEPSRIYVWDAGNNRLLGLAHAGVCVGGLNAGEPCTENSMCGTGGCTGETSQPATLVFGQPGGTGWASCNRDNTREAPAGPDTLCAVPYPYQISPLEGPRGNSMAVDDAHDLYVVDPFNNRVLRFDNPFANPEDLEATRADTVWGQADFASRTCNRGQTAPDADTLCTGEVDRFYPNYYFSAGLDVTPDGGTLWVADLGNHRVLRIPTHADRADLVLGQANFRTREAHCPPFDPRHLCKPNAVRYDPVRDRLYVLDGDADWARVVVFDRPRDNFQPASSVLNAPPSGLFWARGLSLDPLVAGGVWVTDTDHSRLLQYVGGMLTRVLSKGDFSAVGCIGLVGDGPLRPQVCNPHGSLGLDRDGSVYAGNPIESNVVRYAAPIPPPRADGVARSPDVQLFKDTLDYGHLFANRIGPGGLANPGAMALVNGQLLVADRKRIVFWNDFAGGTGESGGPADGVLVQPDLHTQADVPAILAEGDFRALAHDATRRLLYAAQGTTVWAWSTENALHTGQPTEFVIRAMLPLRGGGSTPFEPWGIALDEATDSAFLSDQRGNRLLRVLRFSQPDREVDLILGQNHPEAGDCNRGRDRPVADGFCSLTQVRFDMRGDLYVVDATWEGNGNRRVVAYAAGDLPPIPSPQLTLTEGELRPVRLYSKRDFTTRTCEQDVASHPCTPRAVAFEPGTNRMLLTVDGYGNPLTSRAFIYDDPAPAGQMAPIPSHVLAVPFNQPSDAAWDGDGRLLVLDHTWNRVVLFDNVPALGGQRSSR